MDKVLFTASTYAHIRNFHRPYLRAFHDMGWQVHVACGGARLPIPEADEMLDLPFQKKITAPENLRAQRALRALFLREHYSLVCAHTSLASFFTRRAAAGLRARPPIVNVVHGYLFDDATPLFKRTMLLSAEKLTTPQTDLLITMNAYDRAAAAKHRLCSRIEQVPGIGVDFSGFPATPAQQRCQVRSALGVDETDFLLVYAAEFSPRKNQSMLIRAMAALPKQVKLVLPGDGALRQNCQTLARNLAPDGRVLFPGQVSDMCSLYRASDAAVSASRLEGLPFNIMEAMYCALPVCASNVKGHSDLICDGQTGLLWPYDDEKAFCAAVTRLADDPALCRRLSATAGAQMERFSIGQVLPRVMALYLRAAGRDCDGGCFSDPATH